MSYLTNPQLPPDTITEGMTPKQIGEIMAKNVMKVASAELDKAFGSRKQSKTTRKMEQPIELTLQDLRTFFEKAQQLAKRDESETPPVYSRCDLQIAPDVTFLVTVHYLDRTTRVFNYDFQDIKNFIQGL